MRRLHAQKVSREVHHIHHGLNVGLRTGIVKESVKEGVRGLMRSQAPEEVLELIKAVSQLKREKDKDSLQYFKNTVIKQAYLRDPKLFAELNKAKILN